MYRIKINLMDGSTAYVKAGTVFATMTDLAAEATVYDSTVDNAALKIPFFASVLRRPVADFSVEAA